VHVYVFVELVQLAKLSDQSEYRIK